jgi:hypothetical protein
MEKNRLSIEELEKMTHSDLVCTMTIVVNNDILGKLIFDDNKNHDMTFDVFDGFAYCFDDINKKEYYMLYPKLELVGRSKAMQKSIRDYMELSDDNEIKVTDVMTSYYEIFCNF